MYQSQFWWCILLLLYGAFLRITVAKVWMIGHPWRPYFVTLQFGTPGQYIFTEFSLSTYKNGIAIQRKGKDNKIIHRQFNPKNTISLAEWDSDTDYLTTPSGLNVSGVLGSDLLTIHRNDLPYVLDSMRINCTLITHPTKKNLTSFIGLAPGKEGYLSLMPELERISRSPVILEIEMCGHGNLRQSYHYGGIKFHVSHAEDEPAKLSDDKPEYVKWAHENTNNTDMYPTLNYGVLTYSGQRLKMHCHLGYSADIIPDNSRPGFEFPAKVYYELIDAAENNADRLNLPPKMRIWRRSVTCFNESEKWYPFELYVNLTISFFATSYIYFDITYKGGSLYQRYSGPQATEDLANGIYCYKWAIRKSDREYAVLGRAGMEGLKVFFHRGIRAVGFKPSRCGAPVYVSGYKDDNEDQCMYAGLERVLYMRALSVDSPASFTSFYVIIVIFFTCILVCVCSVPRPLVRGHLPQPIVRIFLPKDQKELLKPESEASEEQSGGSPDDCVCPGMHRPMQ